MKCLLSWTCVSAILAPELPGIMALPPSCLDLPVITMTWCYSCQHVELLKRPEGGAGGYEGVTCGALPLDGADAPLLGSRPIADALPPACEGSWLSGLTGPLTGVWPPPKAKFSPVGMSPVCPLEFTTPKAVTYVSSAAPHITELWSSMHIRHLSHESRHLTMHSKSADAYYHEV